MTITRKLAGTALVASLALGLAAPASASGWNWGNSFRQQIQQLDNRVDRADQRGGISRREAAEMRWQVNRLEDKWHQYARGGFTRSEVGSMRQMIDNVERRLAVQLRDRDRYAHHDRYDRDGRYDRDDRYDRDARYDRGDDRYGRDGYDRYARNDHDRRYR